MNDCTLDAEDGAESISHAVKASSVNEIAVPEVNKDDTDCSSESSHADGNKLDIVSPSAEAVGKKLLPPIEDLNTAPWQLGSASLNSIDDKGSAGYKNTDQDTLEEENSTINILEFAAKESTLNDRKNLNPVNYKVENGLITIHFDFIVAGSGNEKIKECSASEQLQCCSKTEEATDEDAIASARSLSIHQGHEDLSLYGPTSLSAPIASSSQVPYSGSISLRSESSTASARSFAFPILQPEWNSSPVKMAKADRRHLRKQRSWCMGLLCCKF